jgi:hypothetical protein
LFGGISLFDNTYNNANPVYATTAGQRAYEAINGVVQNGNASSAAHGVRGVNYTKGTSGIVGCANNFDFYADGSGTNYGPFTGTHDSLVLKDATFTVGDIVVDKLIFERNGISSTIAEVELTSVENQKNVVGVVCTEPTPLIDHNPAVFIEAQSEESYLGEDEQTHRRSKNVLKSSYETACAVYNHMAINALGEGQVNVCGAGGDIEAGDLISSSAIPGKGMKQADGLVRNITVAKARESVTFSSPSEVKQIACIYMCG